MQFLKKTGAPLYPIALFPMALGIVPALAFGLDFPNQIEMTIGAVVGAVVSMFGLVGLVGLLAYQRKAQVTKLLEEWNKTEGLPKGIFFELGDITGPAPETFWRSVNPRRITIGNGNGSANTIDIFETIEFVFNNLFEPYLVSTISISVQ